MPGTYLKSSARAVRGLFPTSCPKMGDGHALPPRDRPDLSRVLIRQGNRRPDFVQELRVPHDDPLGRILGERGLAEVPQAVVDDVAASVAEQPAARDLLGHDALRLTEQLFALPQPGSSRADSIRRSTAALA